MSSGDTSAASTTSSSHVTVQSSRQLRYETEFSTKCVLGKGSFGEVFQVVNVVDQRTYALKRVRLGCDVALRDKIMREVSLLSSLSHDNVVRYYNAWIEGGSAVPECEPCAQKKQQRAGQKKKKKAKKQVKPTVPEQKRPSPTGGQQPQQTQEVDVDEPSSGGGSSWGISIAAPRGAQLKLPRSHVGAFQSSNAGFAADDSNSDASNVSGRLSTSGVQSVPGSASHLQVSGLLNPLHHAQAELADIEARLKEANGSLASAVAVSGNGAGDLSSAALASSPLPLDIGAVLPTVSATSPNGTGGQEQDDTWAKEPLLQCHVCHKEYTDWDISFQHWQMIDVTLQPFNLCEDCYLRALTKMGVDVSGVQIRRKMRRPLFLYIQMEFCEQSLEERLLASGQLCERARSSASDEKETWDPSKCVVAQQASAAHWHMLRDVVAGVKYLHTQGIVHRDLKPSNIFVTGSHAKIGDLGLATVLPSEMSRLRKVSADILETPKSGGTSSAAAVSPSGQSAFLTGGVGTLLFTAPEVLHAAADTGGYEYDEHCDLYSLGQIILEMFHTGLGTMTQSERIHTLRRVRKGVLPDSFEQNFPLPARLVRALTSRDPSKRPSADSVLRVVDSTSCSSPLLSALVAQHTTGIDIDSDVLQLSAKLDSSAPSSCSPTSSQQSLSVHDNSTVGSDGAYARRLERKVQKLQTVLDRQTQLLAAYQTLMQLPADQVLQLSQLLSSGKGTANPQQQQQAGAAADTDQSADEPVFCICRQPAGPNQMLVQCDLCSEWYHNTCVGLDMQSMGPTYTCPPCCDRTGQEYPFAVVDGGPASH